MGDTRRQVIEGVLYDGGVDVSGEVLNRNDYTLTAAAGFSYSNFGGSLDQELTGIFLPDGDEVDPPENRRCGFNMTFKSPSWEKTDRVFSTTLAAVFASFDCDIVDRAYADADT